MVMKTNNEQIEEQIEKKSSIFEMDDILFETTNNGVVYIYRDGVLLTAKHLLDLFMIHLNEEEKRSQK